MRSVQANRVAVIVLLFSLAFAGHGLTQTSPRKDSGSRDAVTAIKTVCIAELRDIGRKARASGRQYFHDSNDKRSSDSF